MADSDKTLEILIKLGVIGREDAAAVKGLLNETKDAASDLSQSLPQGWEALGKYKEALKGAGEGAEGAHEKIHELHALFARMGPGAEELGHLLHFAFNPAFLATALAAGGLELYFHWIEKCQEKQKEMNDDLGVFNDFQKKVVTAGGNMYDMMFKVQQVTAETRAQVNSLTEQLKDFEARAKVFDLAQNDAIAARISNRKAETEVLQGQITLLESLGKISKDEAEQDKIKVEHQQKIAEIQDKVTQAKSDYNSAKTDYDQQLKTVGGAGAFSPEAIGAAQGAADAAQNKVAQDKLLAGQAGQAQLDELDRKIKENMEEWKKHGADWDPSTAQLRGVAFRNQNDQLVRDRNTLRGEVEGANGSMGADTNAVAVAQQHLKDLQGLHDKFSTLSNNLDILKQKWTDAAHDAPGKEQAENQRAAIESLNTALKGGATPGSIFTDAVNAMYALNHIKEQTGHTPQEFLTHGTPQQQAFIQHLQGQAAALGTMETALGANGNNVIAAINSLTKTAGSNDQALRETVKYAQGLEVGINALRQKIAAMPSQQY